MKKVAFIIVILVASTIISEAQFFVGGSVGLSTNGGSFDDGTTKVDKVSTTSFSFAPKAGLILSDDLWVGLQIGISTQKVKMPGTPEVINKSTEFGIMPFARYSVLHLNKFALAVQGQAGLGFSSEKTEMDGTTNKGPKGTTISFSVFPGITYDISDRVTLEAQIQGFNVGYGHTSSKQDVAGVERTDISNNFGFGVDLDNIVTTGFITIGASIKF